MTREPASVCFFTGTLSILAGAEAATAALANALARRGWRVHIVCQWAEASVYPLDDRVTVHAIFPQRRSFKASYVTMVLRLRAYLRAHRLAILVDVDTQLTWFSLPATVGLQVAHLSWEHAQFTQDLGRRSRRIARWMAARWCDAVVVLTARDGAEWSSRLRMRARLAVVPNPLTLQPPPRSADVTQTRVLAVGRLEHVKGFDLLLNAWSHIHAVEPSWNLHIVGDGSKRDALLAERDALGLTQSVTFIPATRNIAAHYSDASILAMSSRHEGFGLVLIEAMAHGLAIASFACETGPRELLTDGQTALLAPPGDIAALAAALLKLMRSIPLRQELAANGRVQAQRYDPDEVASHWDRLLRSCSHQLAGGSR